MTDSNQEIKVYLVRILANKELGFKAFWYPQPFARRVSAERWASERYKEYEFKVEGFRVRG